MQNKVVKISELSEDFEKPIENDGFWDNVPREKDGYVITDKVRGV